MRSPEPRNCNRRSGSLPGRRFAFTLALALAVAAVCAASAAADQTVVSATIYPASKGSVTQKTVGLSALGSCPNYDGSNPIYLYPAQQPYQLTSNSWSLSTVLSCGLQLPLAGVTNVQVLNPGQGFEAPLSNADLSDSSRYQDPQAPDALPAISVDGSENQTTYIRPFRGGSDDNARDLVTESGAPITLVVYANGLPLQVNASAQTLSHTATTATAKFQATVQTAAGSPLAPSALNLSWNFGDGGTSTGATPTHQFAAGSYDVTVQVTDAASGTGGTATVQYITPANPVPGSTTQRGGSKPGKSKSHTGTSNGTHGNRPAGTPGSKHASGSANGLSDGNSSTQPTNPASPSPSPASTSPSSSTPTTPVESTSTTTATTTTTTTTTTSSTPIPAGSSSNAHPEAPRSERQHGAPRHPPPPAPAGRLVSGRLISDVIPLPAGSSPLVHLAPAAAAPPLVQQATRTSNLAAMSAALIVVALLWLGAWRELRGTRRARALPPGH